MNRRQILTTTGAVASLGLCAGIVVGVPGCTPAPAAEAYPIADLADAYVAVNVRLNRSNLVEDDEVDAFVNTHIDPLRDRMIADAPAPVTMVGALTAIRLAERSFDQGDIDLAEALVVAVRRFLEGRA